MDAALPFSFTFGYALRAVCLDGCVLNLRHIAKESVLSAQTRELVHPDIKPENPPERAAH